MSLFYINKAFLVGNITKDVVLKSTPSGKSVCNFSVATNQSVKKGDDWEDIPTYHNIVAWEGLAKIAERLSKGSKVMIEGKITYREYEKDGVKKYFTEILASKIIGLSNSNQGATQGATPEQAGEALGVNDTGDTTAQDIADEVPF